MDPASLGLLATALVAEKALESTGDKAGESAWAAVAAIADRVRGWFNDNADLDGTKALEVVEAAPDSVQARGALGAMVDAAVAGDRQLRIDLEALVAAAEESGDIQIARFLSNFNAPVERVNQVAGDYHEHR
jgi:hypothetical protein